MRNSVARGVFTLNTNVIFGTRTLAPATLPRAQTRHNIYIETYLCLCINVSIYMRHNYQPNQRNVNRLVAFYVFCRSYKHFCHLRSALARQLSFAICCNQLVSQWQSGKTLYVLIYITRHIPPKRFEDGEAQFMFRQKLQIDQKINDSVIQHFRLPIFKIRDQVSFIKRVLLLWRHLVFRNLSCLVDPVFVSQPGKRACRDLD